MRFGTARVSEARHKRSDAPRSRQTARAALVASICVLLAACANPFAGDSEEGRGRVGFVTGFIGGVAADEPQAALIGRDVLSSGGNAIDAATAMYFALSVTMPSSAGLAGGGVCMVHHQPSNTTQALEFLPRSPSTVPLSADRPSALPGNPRGFFVLHSRFGRMPWPQIISPAENLARFGHTVSRAFATRLAQAGPELLRDPAMRRAFGRPDGGVIGEGDRIVRPELAAVLGRLRANGVGDFYIGSYARSYANAVEAAGGSLSEVELRAYQPNWREPIAVDHVLNTKFLLPPPPAAAGTVEAQMLAMLLADARFRDAGPAERKHLLIEVAKRAYADRAAWQTPSGDSRVPPAELISEARVERLMRNYDPDRATPIGAFEPAPAPRPETTAATTFAVFDNEGSAVSCGLTMNGLFGTLRMVPGFGIIPAAAPDSQGRTYTPLGPFLLINKLHNVFYFAGAASGGVAASTSLVNVAADAIVGDSTLADAIAAPRVHHAGAPDTAFVESTLDTQIKEALSRRGHRLEEAGRIGLVNAVFCSSGLPVAKGDQLSCSSETDPRGTGLATSAD